jgi:hypothetical protein
MNMDDYELEAADGSFQEIITSPIYNRDVSKAFKSKTNMNRSPIEFTIHDYYARGVYNPT